MNIFYLHPDPMIAGRAMSNKHVISQCKESAQLLCTAHLVLDGHETIGLSKSGRKQKQFVHPASNILYKVTHINHPSAVWVRQCAANYSWLWHHFTELCHQYTQRYGRVHATEKKLLRELWFIPDKISRDYERTPMPQAMPEQYHNVDSVVAYRAYYEAEKLKTQVDIDRYNSVLDLELKISKNLGNS
jgi:hypothetical protein